MSLIESLARTADLRTIETEDAVLIRALRQWVVTRKGHGCGFTALAGWIGSRRAAGHLHLLLEEIGAAWPEPFCVSPPCCPRLSHDEALLLAMLARGREDDRPGFDRLLAEMLPGEVRDRLFLSITVFGQVLEA